MSEVLMSLQANVACVSRILEQLHPAQACYPHVFREPRNAGSLHVPHKIDCEVMRNFDSLCHPLGGLEVNVIPMDQMSMAGILLSLHGKIV